VSAFPDRLPGPGGASIRPGPRVAPRQRGRAGG